MKKFLACSCVLLLFGCATSAKDHRDDVRDDTGERVSVGTVQREIRTGMSGADVISVLGSPNMVTSDGKRRETWVYDKISTEHVYSNSSTSGSVLGLGGGIGSGGGGVGLFGRNKVQHAGAAATSQRTLTIIIKFDENNLVRDFSYRQSSF